MSVPILRLKDIKKYYSGHKAVDGISFEVQPQTIFGMLGPNGAGKTTTIRMITNILMPDSGEILFGSEALREDHRSLIGYMPEERGLYKKMKVFEQLVYLSQLKGMSKSDASHSINEWMERLNIKDWANKNVQDLSKGMQQKIQFICTVAHNPKLIILDEPFSGLDPVNSELIKNEIYELRQKGATIIFSTHRMEQVEEICEQIVLINKGKIVLDGAVGAIKQGFKEHKYRLGYEGELPVLPDYVQYNTEGTPRGTAILSINNNMSGNDVLKYLIEKGCVIVSFNEILPTLNEIFIKVVGS